VSHEAGVEYSNVMAVIKILLMLDLLDGGFLIMDAEPATSFEKSHLLLNRGPHEIHE
jgi:hypothetical protein